MKSRTKRKCEWLVNHLKERGYWKEVPIREVKYEIDEHVGGDKRTVDKYLKKLVEYGFMKLKNLSVMQFCDAYEGPKEVPKDTLMNFLVVKDDEPP